MQFQGVDARIRNPTQTHTTHQRETAIGERRDKERCWSHMCENILQSCTGNIDSHTHTHTHTQREREREKFVAYEARPVFVSKHQEYDTVWGLLLQKLLKHEPVHTFLLAEHDSISPG